ncbi:uncharacterized protein (DUF1800 family) [Rhizobium azooxidifex]|uniref:Uncharacterized protein (DUF1800 family) n=1 Tax=Mycoplana azooxidifex TaxID=1636188 RepID=A0A7W6DDH8_9HYPH|nr:DUF1800 domain-containing protein [Mycoplana azooxidifex]MBB3977788.1 uncharacterized protein (DUF1800 family) [Mycoplana azooxidifex]
MTNSIGTIAAHRFGTGPRPGELPAGTVDALLAQVTRGVAETCPFPYDGISGRRASFPAFRSLYQSYREQRENGTVRKVGDRLVNPFQIALNTALLRDQHLKISHAVQSPNGFFERLAAFWCDHFAVNVGKSSSIRILVGLYEAEALRPNLAGRFASLLQAAILHSAMLAYLDQPKSVGPNSPVGRKRGRGLNENLARELIELHTLGADGGYTQDDVRAAAYVLTGLDHDGGAFETVYRVAWAEPGIHRVLGRDYGGPKRSLADVEALLADLAAQEATRRHICRKLVVHFIADEPPPEIVDAMVAAWSRTDGELIEVYRAMLEHPRSWEQDGQKARQPFDFVVAGLRALDVPAEALAPPAVTPRRPERAAMAMPQDGTPEMSMMAADEAGTEDAAVEMSAGGANAATVTVLAAPTADGRVPIRANPLSVGALQRLGQPLWRPPSPAGWDEELSVWITAAQLTQRIDWARDLVARFGDDRDPRRFVKAVLGDAARDDTIQVVSQASSREAGLVLTLASPEFNRR